MASVMYCLARSPAVSRASASSRLSRLAASCRASPSICLSSSSLASSAVRLATRSSSCCCCATSRSYFSAGRFGGASRARRRPSPAPCSSLSVRSIVAWRSASAASRRISVCSSACACWRSWRACVSASRQQLVRLLLGFEQGFLLAGFGVALGVLDDAERLLFGAADGFGGDALAVRDPDGEHGGGRHQR